MCVEWLGLLRCPGGHYQWQDDLSSWWKRMRCADDPRLSDVQQGDGQIGKTTCRPGGNECAVTTPTPTTKPIPDWATCQKSKDTCASNGWVCCVAPADVSSGKTTCRPGGSECSTGQPPASGTNFAGANSYFLHTLSQADRLEILDKFQSAGLRTLRIFISRVGGGGKGTSSSGVQDLESNQVGQYDDTILKQVDQLMWEAYQRNIKLVIALHDRWALGCWDSDAYVSKYNLPTTYCGQAVNRADTFYTNTNAQTDFDRRLAHILQHKNPNFGNRAWGNIPEAILGFEPQNESQGWLHSWNNGQLVVPNPNWVCDRATKMRQNIPNKNILILSGGGTDYDSCKLINFFQCPAVDVVSIHTYADADSNVFSQFVSLANQNNKRVIVEEFGYTGNKAANFANFMSTAQSAGLPWMMWEVLKPGNTGDYETWTDEGSAWQAIANGAAAANSNKGQFLWPELAVRS
ncbi:unnamed protein product [Aphanomyces euteiches]|uniref:mannan endo-1,4-beta-mannosidase n=1 Tax=Aphanomyces euteiches TaxID=100861 RepID=A0A6G0WQJ0_9STRA|nr:hypothetical protein Ae201684_012735 [Aphanomyces euteiches]